MNTTDEKLDAAHARSSRHRLEIEASDECACFYCRRRFLPGAITEWTDDGETALCPHCGIDSVLGSASGFSLRPEFISAMHYYWFKR